MNPLIQFKLCITRFLGPDKWNDVLLKNGFKKFKKAQPDLAAEVEKNIKYKETPSGDTEEETRKCSAKKKSTV